MNRTILKSTGAILAGFITVAVLPIGTYYPNRILLQQVPGQRSLAKADGDSEYPVANSRCCTRLATPYSDSRAAAPPPANSNIQRGSQRAASQGEGEPSRGELEYSGTPQQQPRTRVPGRGRGPPQPPRSCPRLVGHRPYLSPHIFFPFFLHFPGQ